MTKAKAHFEGPVESGPFPNQLLARVVSPGQKPLLHGYDIEDDLAPHYGLVEVTYLALTGELPETDIALALNAVLIASAPVSVAHASTHAAVLSQLCGAETASTLAVAAIGLAEQAKHALDQHKDLFEWLTEPTRPFPSRHVAASRNDMDSLESLNRALRPSRLRVPGLEHGPTFQAARLLVLHACGLRTSRQLQAILVWARLPLVAAEAFAETEANFRNYPINLPRYEYEEQPR